MIDMSLYQSFACVGSGMTNKILSAVDPCAWECMDSKQRAVLLYETHTGLHLVRKADEPTLRGYISDRDFLGHRGDRSSSSPAEPANKRLGVRLAYGDIIIDIVRGSQLLRM